MEYALKRASYQPMRSWDDRSQRFSFTYDALRRPVDRTVSVSGGSEKLLGRIVYGELLANPADTNVDHAGLDPVLFAEVGDRDLVDEVTADDLGLLLGGVVAALAGVGGHGGSPDDRSGWCPISTGAGQGRWLRDDQLPIDGAPVWIF